MLKSTIEDATIRTGGGVVTYASSYTIAHTVLTVKDVSDIATVIATLATALYFFVQFLYIIWKWRREAKQR